MELVRGGQHSGAGVDLKELLPHGAAVAGLPAALPAAVAKHAAAPPAAVAEHAAAPPAAVAEHASAAGHPAALPAQFTLLAGPSAALTAAATRARIAWHN